MRVRQNYEMNIEFRRLYSQLTDDRRKKLRQVHGISLKRNFLSLGALSQRGTDPAKTKAIQRSFRHEAPGNEQLIVVQGYGSVVVEYALRRSRSGMEELANAPR